MGRVKPSCPGKARPLTRVPRVCVGLRRCAYGSRRLPRRQLLRRRRHCAHRNIAHCGYLRPVPKARSPRALGATSLCRMRTHRIPSVPRWARPRPVLDARSPTGRGKPPRFSEGDVGPRSRRPSIAAGSGGVASPVFEPEACCSAPGELGERRDRRDAQEGVGGFRGSVSLGPFLSRQERSSPSGARTRFK